MRTFVFTQNQNQSEVEVGRLDAEGRAEKECWWQLWAGVGFWARGVALGFRAV